MAWTVPITIEGQTYPVRFDSENEPTQEDIADAANYIISQQSAPQEDTGQGRLSTFASGVARGVLSPVPGVIGGAGALTGIDALTETAETIEQGINETFPMNPAYQEEFWTGKAPQAIGQGISMLATGGIGGAIGKGLAAGRGLSAAGQAAAATQAATRTMIGTGAAMGAREGQQEGEKYGLTGLNLYARIWAGTLLEPATEKLPFGMLAETSAMKRIFGDAINARPVSSAGILATETAEEGLASVGGDIATNIGATIEGTEGIGLGEMVSRAGENAALGTIGGAPIAGLNLLAGKQEEMTFGGTHARQPDDTAFEWRGMEVRIPKDSPLKPEDVRKMGPVEFAEAADKLQIKIPRPSSVVAAELTKLAATGQPVPIDPQAIRPEDAPAIVVASQTNPETLAGVVAMTTNTTPVAAPQSAPVAPVKSNAQLLGESKSSLDDRAKALGFAGIRQMNVQVGLRDDLSGEQRQLIDEYGKLNQGLRSLEEQDASQLSDENFEVWSKPLFAPEVTNEGDLADMAKLHKALTRRGEIDNANRVLDILKKTQRRRTDWTPQSWEQRFPGEGKSAAEISTINNDGKSWNDKLDALLESINASSQQTAPVAPPTPAPAVTPAVTPPEIVAGVEEFTDAEALAIDAELGIEPPSAAIPPQQTQQQPNENDQTIQQGQGQVAQEADAQANTQAQEGVLTPAPSPVVPTQAAAPQPTPTPTQTNVQNQVQEASRPTLVESVPSVVQPEGQAQAGTPQREGQGQEVADLMAVRDNTATPEQVQRLQGQGLVEQVAGQTVITQAGIQAMPETERPRLTEQERRAEIQQQTQQPAGETQQPVVDPIGYGNALIALFPSLQKAGVQAITIEEAMERLEAEWQKKQASGKATRLDQIVYMVNKKNTQSALEGANIGGIWTRTDKTVAVSSKATPSAMAHEIGHAIMELEYANAPEATKKAIEAEYSKWFAAKYGKDGVPSVADQRRIWEWMTEADWMNPDAPFPQEQRVAKWEAYRSKFSEWFADEVAKWAATRDAPKSLVDKFFSELAQKLKKLWDSVRGSFSPNETLASWLDSISVASPAKAQQPAGDTGDAGVTIPGSASTELEREAIISSPQYTQQWLQDETAKAQEEGVQGGDTVITRDESGETVVGVVEATDSQEEAALEAELLEESQSVEQLPDEASVEEVQQAAPVSVANAAAAAVSAKNKTEWLQWMRSNLAHLMRFAEKIWRQATATIAAAAALLSPSGTRVTVSNEISPQAYAVSEQVAKPATFGRIAPWVAAQKPSIPVSQNNLDGYATIDLPEVSSQGGEVILNLSGVDESNVEFRKSPLEQAKSAAKKLKGDNTMVILPKRSAKYFLNQGSSAHVDALAEMLYEQESTSPKISAMLKSMGISESPDTFPWCATSASFALTRAGIKTSNASSRQFLSFGTRTEQPQYGDVVVMWNDNPDTGGKAGWGGHVGFYLGEVDGAIAVLSGNAKDEVNVSLYSKDRVLEYRSVGQPKFSRTRLRLSDGRTVEVPTAGLVRQSPQSLSRKPGLAQALMESDGAALQLGVSARDVEKGIAATKRQIPGASNIWSGTRQEFLDTFGNDPSVQDVVAQLEEGVMTEGFYVPSLQRGFILTDGVVIYQGDADRAALNGTTPAVEAVKRLIRHEVGGHGGWLNLTERQTQDFLKIARDVIPVSDMNQMIEDGYPFEDWQTNDETFRQAAEEWFSQRLGRMDKLPETGPLARFVEWLKGVWRWLTGRKGEPDIQAIKNLWRQIRMNEAAIAMGRAWYSLPREGARAQAVTAGDEEYLAAVKAGDIPAETPVYGPESRIELSRKFGIPSALNGPRSRVMVFWDESNDKIGAVIVLPERTAPSTPVTEQEMNDRRYIALVESYEKGNPVLQELQRMVNEAARAAGFTTKAYHKTWESFNEFIQGGNLQETNQWVGKNGKIRTLIGKSGKGFFFSLDRENTPAYHNQKKTGEKILDVYLKYKNPLAFDKDTKDWAIDVFGDENKEFPRIITNEAYDLVKQDYDSIEIYKGYNNEADPNEVIVLDPNQIKSADPVTYDSNGAPIPLSQRFQSTSNDIRYSRVRSNAEIASAIRQQATLPNDPQTASEGKVIREDVAVRFEPNNRRSIQQSPDHQFLGKDIGVERGAAILDTLMQPERDPAKIAESTPQEIEQQGGDVELNLIAHEEAVRRALVLGEAVSTAALTRYGISLPPDYRKFGELSAPVSPALIRATEFLTNQSLTEQAGIGMSTTLYPYIAYRLMSDLATAQTNARSNVERVALSQAMTRIYEATSGTNSQVAQRQGATGIAQRYFGVTAGGVMALVENVNREVQGRIDASIPVDDLVAELNRNQTQMETEAVSDAAAEIEAETEIDLAEADMLKQEGIAEGIIEEIANRLGDAPVVNDVERKEREATIRDLHLRNVRQGMTEQDFITEAATFEVYEGLASRLWNAGNLEREARATIKAAIDGVRRQEIAESRASRLIYATEERLRQGSKDLYANASGDSINKAFRDQIKTPVSLADFKERLSKLSVGGGVAERLFRTAEREKADLAEMDLIISKRREEKRKAAQVEIAESRASDLIYSVEERLRQGSKDLDQGTGKDTINKAFRDQVKSPVSQEDFNTRLAALNVSGNVAERLFKTAERERADLAKAKEFTDRRRAETEEARQSERAEARASQLIYSTEERLRQGSKDLDESESRDSINKAFRDQIKSPVSLAEFKARLAKLRVGDVVADRLFKTASRERDDIAESERFLAQRRLERKDQRKIEIAQERASQLIYGVEERLRQGQKDMTENAAKDTINKAFRDQVAKPVSFENFQARLRNLRVNDRNIERMFNTAERERIDLGKQALMQTRENLLEKDSPHLAAVIRRIKDKIAPGISWRDLMVVDAQDGKQRARAIYQRVRQHEALRGLSPAEAAQLTRALNRHFIKAKEKVLKKELERVGAMGTQTDPRVADLYEKIRKRELTAAEVEAELQAIATSSRWKVLRRELPTFLQDLAYGRVSIEQFKEKIGRGRKATDRAIQSVIDSTPKLIQAMNLGAFNAQAFRDAVSEKFGLRVITSEQARKIQQMVVDAQALQPGLPRDKAVAKIIDQIADYTQMSSAEIFNSFWVSSVLSGGRTQFDTWMNQLNAMRRVLQLAAWTSAKRINEGGLNIGWNAITRYFEVLPGMFQNALWYLWSGDSTLLLSEARETDRFLNDGQFSQSMDTKKAEKLLSGALTALRGGDLKQGILAFPAFFIVGVRRLMQAADYFSAAATLEASIPLAIALNPELAGRTKIPSRQDYQNFRLRAREILTGGREPKGMREKTEERVMAQQLLMQSIDSLAIRDEIMELGIEASYQNDPTGIGGIFYNSVLAVHQKIVASAEALRERGQSMQESDSPEILKKADAAARNLMYALAVGARALTGLQFARFAGNKTNELLGMTPLLGLARLAEKDKTRSQKAMIIMDNLVGTAIAVGGIIYAMGLLDDDDDDERRGWRIEGGWDGLTAEETRQLRAAGKQPYSIGYLDRQDGTWKNYSYLQWATSGAFATIGNLRDRKRYRPELWNEDSYVGATLAAAAGNGQALLNMSMLQNLNDIFGGNSAFAARDPVSGMAGWLNRFSSNYAGGFIPRAFKDLDYMMDPRHTKANAGIELWLQHVPFYRRGVGEAYLDSLGYQVELRREPWSRAFVETQGTAAHNALASLVGKGMFISSLNMDNRVVRNGEDVRPMTDAEQKRMMDVYFPLLRRYLVREGARIERMPMEDAKEKLSNDIQRLKTKAQDRAVR